MDDRISNRVWLCDVVEDSEGGGILFFFALSGRHVAKNGLVDLPLWSGTDPIDRNKLLQKCVECFLF